MQNSEKKKSQKPVPRRKARRDDAPKKQRKHSRIKLALLAVVALQLFYPGDVARPFARVSGHSVGLQSLRQIQDEATLTLNRDVIFVLGDTQNVTNPAELGVTILAPALAAEVIDYPLWQRLLPGSLLFGSADSSEYVQIPEAATATFSRWADESATEPVEPIVAIDGTVTPGQAGERYSPEAMALALQKNPYKTEHALQPESLMPRISDAAAEAYASMFVDGNTQITVQVAGYDEVSYAHNDIAATIAEHTLNASGDGYVPRFDLAGLSQLVAGQSWAAEVGSEHIAAALSTMFLNGESSITLDPVGTVTVAGQDYRLTNAELERLLADTASRLGLEASVVVQSFGAVGVQASYRADEVYDSASIYKLFLAEYLYQKVDQGELTPDFNVNGNDLATCLEIMITLSDSPCPEAMMAFYGQAELTQELAAAGYPQTSLETITTSAADTSLLLERIYSGLGLSDAAQQSLIDDMFNQRYRSSIPAGVDAATVANKVGFYDLGASWNDAALIYREGGVDYSLAILTKDGSNTEVAALTRAIDAFMRAL